ncbi:hypothetical protein THAOC_12415, partial [Thalassiosira oceanica]
MPALCDDDSDCFDRRNRSCCGRPAGGLGAERCPSPFYLPPLRLCLSSSPDSPDSSASLALPIHVRLRALCAGPICSPATFEAHLPSPAFARRASTSNARPEHEPTRLGLPGGNARCHSGHQSQTRPGAYLGAFEDHSGSRTARRHDDGDTAGDSSRTRGGGRVGWDSCADSAGLPRPAVTGRAETLSGRVVALVVVGDRSCRCRADQEGEARRATTGEERIAQSYKPRKKGSRGGDCEILRQMLAVVPSAVPTPPKDPELEEAPPVRRTRPSSLSSLTASLAIAGGRDSKASAAAAITPSPGGSATSTTRGSVNVNEGGSRTVTMIDSDSEESSQYTSEYSLSTVREEGGRGYADRSLSTVSGLTSTGEAPSPAVPRRTLDGSSVVLLPEGGTSLGSGFSDNSSLSTYASYTFDRFDRPG